MYENIVYHLKGINDQLVPTIELTKLEVQIGNKTIRTNFQVVHANFPIAQDGIHG